MTNVVFKQPPLVEIIAEIRWDIAGQPVLPPQHAGAPFLVPDGSAHEAHFMNFTSKAGANGFGLIERIVPSGFPLLANQVAFRFRKNPQTEGAPLFQIGPGIFTANIAPPYKSWQTFLPFIELGLEMLFESCADADKDRKISSVRLRYLDAFGENLRKGKPVSNFLREVLGVKIELPESVMKFCSDKDEIKPAIAVTMPIDIGEMELKISNGWVRNVPSLVMDTTIICKGPLDPNKAAILEKLNAAHDVIHESFVGMTVPIHELMEKQS